MECSHPMLYKNMCTACGAKVRKSSEVDQEYSANFAASGGREVQITSEEAERIEQANISALQDMKKLSLVLDLDHTLLNSTASTNHPDEKMRGSHELIMTDNGRTHKYSVMLRPNLQYFLEELSPLYQMSIYTHGTRKYAEGTCKIMDPDGLYFGKRIVSRSDHPELGASKSLSRLLKTDWCMVLIYDDREDVWKGEQGDHLLSAKPFVHFDTLSKEVVNNSPGTLSMDNKAKKKGVISTSCNEDEALIQAVSIFKMLHEKYFSSVKQHDKLSVGRILKEYRVNILTGCVICFSGVIPRGGKIPPQKHVLWKIARMLGAEVEFEVTDRTSHLLALDVGTSKTRECLARDDVFVLHCDWLLHCHWNLKREDESMYSLKEAHKPIKANSKVTDRAAELAKRPLQSYEEEGDIDVPCIKKSRYENINYNQDNGVHNDDSDSSSDDESWLQELENEVESTDEKEEAQSL